MAIIRVGVAGWDYPDWTGTVYPARIGRGFDRLAYLCRFVDAIEINTTFYRPADPRMTSSWVRRTERSPGFRFTAKAHRSWTHDASTPTKDGVAATLAGLVPLRDAGVLGAILVQFPQAFHRTPGSFERLERLLECVDGWPTVVEVRHISWDNDQAVGWFRERAVGWCVVDQPEVAGSTAGARPRVTSPIGYVRLHGRNSRDWFREEAGRDARYDYLYTLEELRPVTESVRAMTRQADEIFIIQNNHFRGKALVNALQMKHLLQQIRPTAPEHLVEAYPGLAGSVTVKRERLL